MKHILLILTTFLALSLNAQTAEEAKELHNKGRECYASGKIAEGREATKQAMDIRKKLFGEVNEDYISSLYNYGLSYALEENYNQSIEEIKKVLALCNKLKTPHHNLGMVLTRQGRNYYHIDYKEEAARHWEKALPLVEKFSDDYEQLINWLSAVYSAPDDMEKIEWLMKLAEEHNQHELKKECNEPGCMLERAEYYAVTGDNTQAKTHFLKALSMQMDDEMKLKVNLAYAKYLTNTKEFTTSAEYYAAAALIQKELKGTDEDYANYTYMAGIRFYLGKEYQRSLSYFQQSLDYHATINSPVARRNEVRCWKAMGNSYRALQDYVAAKEYCAKVVRYYESNDTTNKEYPKSIERLASAEKFNNDYDDAIAHYKQALEIYEKLGMTVEYADAANALKLCYVYAKKTPDVDVDEEAVQKARHAKIDKMINESLAAMEVTRKYLGKLIYAQSLATTGGLYAQKEDYTNAVAYFKKYIPAIREAVRDEFRMQSADERMTLWNQELTNINSIRELLVTLPVGLEDVVNDLTAILYDTELLSKGILLNSSIEFEKVLNFKGDEKLSQTYITIKLNEEKIASLRNTASTEDELNALLALMQQNQELQLQLYKGCAEFADFTDYISYTWKDVQNAMTSTDIAIEFVGIEYNVLPQDNFMVALVLTKDMTSPIAIPVCNLQQAEAMTSAENVFEIDNLLWGAFQKQLEGKKRIFFAADNSFNRIGIEYLLYNGVPLSEQFEVYRLSSTKEICKKHTHKKPENIVLFGDINYNESALPTSVAKAKGKDGLRASDNGFDNLEFSAMEIEGINDIFKANKAKDVEIYTDTLASKEAFLALTDTPIDILHVATHGAYTAGTKATDAESMGNSVLVFAGANMTIGTGESLVSAAEVAKMNLRNCDLAVLSACETGLGKLGSDGVVGLQRGVMIAGGLSLLMSLKKVYDSSTAEMMVCFYNNLMAGQSKREALVNAQKEIKAKGYNDAKYWASFILLDAFSK